MRGFIYVKSKAGGSERIRPQLLHERRRGNSSRQHSCDKLNDMSDVKELTTNSDADDEADRPEFVGVTAPRVTSANGYAPPSRTLVRENLVDLEPDNGNESSDSDGDDAPWVGRRGAWVTTTTTTSTTTAASMVHSRRSPHALRGQACTGSIKPISPPQQAAAAAAVASGLDEVVDVSGRKKADVERMLGGELKVSFDCYW